jgi:hypothetical protein
MVHQRHPGPTPLSFTPRRPGTTNGASRARVAFGLALSTGWLAGCAGLLGIEDATCDPTYDPGCAGRFGALMPGAGNGGSATTAGAAGNAGSAGNSGSAGNGGSAGNAGSAGNVGSGENAAAAGGNGGALDTDPSVEPPLCERYCDTIAAACTGDNEQYASPMACRAVCALLDPGERGNFSGNSIECRLARAQLAQATGEPASYCSSAGPGGGGVCGTDCEGFCTIMAQTCTLMGSFEQCLPLCGDVPNLTDQDEALTYATSIQDGNSVQCRLYHVTAATLDSRTHCSHAAGVALCVDD